MDGYKSRRVLACLLWAAFAASCASDPTAGHGGGGGNGDDFSQLDAEPGKESLEANDSEKTADSPTESADAKPATKSNDAFADFDSESPAPSPSGNEEDRLEKEMAQANPDSPTSAANAEIAQSSEPTPEPSVNEQENLAAPSAEPPVVAENVTPPPSTTDDSFTAPPTPDAAPIRHSMVTIQNMGIQSPAGGPILEIRASGPIEYEQNVNSGLNQLVIDIPNSKLGPKMKFPLNMRDFSGPIASVTAYTVKASHSRIVVQLRRGAQVPTIEATGNHLLVRTDGVGEKSRDQIAAATDRQTAGEAAPVTEHSIMSSNSLEDFLANNQKFYGQEISIETDDTELRDVLKLISEEAHVNLVVTDEVKGKISVKLKNTPWDQALIMIMKSKKLGYSRSGNILRIAPVADLKKEEEDSLSLIAARKTNGNLVEKSLQINYAKVEELEKQIKTILSARGTVVADTRTSALIITDIQENLQRALQLVQTLDIPPQQVLIEGKVVEAQDSFERDVGFNWGLSGRTTQIPGAKTTSGPLRFNQTVNVTPGTPSRSAFGLNFNIGTFDVIGDLQAALQLYETMGTVKVLSSPRVVALHNEKSEIDQDMQIPLITATTSASGAVSPTVNYKDVRLKLEVTPLVTNEGTVIMDVSVLREFPGAVIDQATQARPVNSRAAKTKVMVRNGQTAVIGGIYENNMTDSETRVPGLASIPLLGWLFKNKTKNSTHEELLIFLTPKILASAQAQPGLLNSDNTPTPRAEGSF